MGAIHVKLVCLSNDVAMQPSLGFMLRNVVWVSSWCRGYEAENGGGDIVMETEGVARF